MIYIYILINFFFCFPVPSAPPMKIQGSHETNQSIILRWSHPPLDQINGPLLGYKVSYITSSTNKYEAISCS